MVKSCKTLRLQILCSYKKQTSSIDTGGSFILSRSTLENRDLRSPKKHRTNGWTDERADERTGPII